MSYDVLAPEDARLWPYAPDWSRRYDVRRSFRTDISTSRNDTEQRRALRTDPRFSVKYSTVVSGAARRAADHHMRAWQNKPSVAPDFARWARLTGATSGGGSTLTISPMPVWIAEGQTLVLCATGVVEQVLVDSVAGTTATLVAGVDQAWPIGSVVRPTIFGLMSGEISSSRENKAVATIDVAIEAFPGGEPPRATGAAWATYNGHEVFTLQPDYAAPPGISYLWPVEQVDYKHGRTAQFRPIEQAARSVEAEFNGLDVTGAEELEQFFDRMKGMRDPFYMPTWEADFELAATAGSATNTFLATGPELAADFASVDFDDGWAIAVCLTTGAQLYRLVTGIAAESGNSRITVSAAWGQDITAANLARISWMPLWRFASDDMTTSWVTPLKANARLPFRQIKVPA